MELLLKTMNKKLIKEFQKEQMKNVEKNQEREDMKYHQVLDFVKLRKI